MGQHDVTLFACSAPQALLRLDGRVALVLGGADPAHTLPNSAKKTFA